MQCQRSLFEPTLWHQRRQFRHSWISAILLLQVTLNCKESGCWELAPVPDLDSPRRHAQLPTSRGPRVRRAVLPVLWL